MRCPGMEPTEEEMEQARQRVKELKESGALDGDEGLSSLKIGNKIAYGTLAFLISIICYAIYWFFDDGY